MLATKSEKVTLPQGTRVASAPVEEEISEEEEEEKKPARRRRGKTSSERKKHRLEDFLPRKMSKRKEKEHEECHGECLSCMSTMRELIHLMRLGHRCVLH